MPAPKKGDVVVWCGRVYEIVEDPQHGHSRWGLDFCTWTAVGRLLNILHNRPDGWEADKGKTEPIVFIEETVEASGWKYFEDPFVSFAKRVIRERGEGVKGECTKDF